MVFYCYSIPLRNFLEKNGIYPLNEIPKINPNSNKYYWEYKKGKSLDEFLSIWKENKIKAIEFIKTNN